MPKIKCPFCHLSFNLLTNKRLIRTNQQNRLYWGAIIKIAGNYFGYSDEEMHEAFKFMFLRRDEYGKPLTVRSTTKLDTKSFYNYVNQCIKFCAEHGIVIPDQKESYE